MTPIEQVAYYTPSYSLGELIFIGLVLTACLAGPSLLWWADHKRRQRRADIRGKRAPKWYEGA